MTRVLRVDASARVSRSLSRALASTFEQTLLNLDPTVEILRRDVGQKPPPFISEDWIAAAFTEADRRTPEQSAQLAWSDMLIAELRAADVILIATPMYNYGMPAALKAWVDQVVRVNETFTFDLARGDRPIEPTLTGKTMVLLTASGEFGFAPGGVNAPRNHLAPHLRTVGEYLGVSTERHVAIEFQEFRDDRHAQSVEAAHQSARDLAAELLTALDQPPSSRPKRSLAD